MAGKPSGARLIALERERQRKGISQGGEGYSSVHDYGKQDQLAMAAVCYAMPPSMGFRRSTFWPWHRNMWKPKTRMEDLIRAGALIAAAIDEVSRQQEAK